MGCSLRLDGLEGSKAPICICACSARATDIPCDVNDGACYPRKHITSQTMAPQSANKRQKLQFRWKDIKYFKRAKNQIQSLSSDVGVEGVQHKQEIEFDTLRYNKIHNYTIHYI